MNTYSSININKFLESDTPQQGEQILIDSYANFSCPINKDVETFLLHHSISSSKKGQSATYLVVNDSTEEIVGYYSLAIKPISVPTNCISKTSIKKLSRISDYDEITNTHTLSAYLINHRMTKGSSPHKLHQLLKFI